MITTAPLSPPKQEISGNSTAAAAAAKSGRMSTGSNCSSNNESATAGTSYTHTPILALLYILVLLTLIGKPKPWMFGERMMYLYLHLHALYDTPADVCVYMYSFCSKQQKHHIKLHVLKITVCYPLSYHHPVSSFLVFGFFSGLQFLVFF